jgi:uncharacterized protein (TIGR04222 family)
MNTWGISGPYFLLLYAGLFIAAWTVVLAARRRIAAPAGPAAVPGQRELGLYEAAMLNGGGRLALAAAACRLKQARRLRLDRDVGTVVALGRLPANADPVEEWLYTRVKGSAAGASDVLGERPAEPVLGPIRDGLRERGLILTGRQTASMRWQVLWFAPLLALGVLRVVAGTANHKPVLYLVLLMLLSLALAISLCLPRRGVSASSISRLFCLPRITSAGARALAGMRAAPGGEGGSAVPGRAGLARTVALNGLGAVALADAAFAAMLGVRSGSGWWSGDGWGGGGCGGGGGGCGG